GDVDVVGAPVGHLAAGILAPPAKRVMTAFRNVGNVRRLPLPQVPVEMRWRLHGFERPAGRILVGDGGHPAQATDAPGMDQLTGQAEMAVTALPGAHLEDPVRLVYDPAEQLALVNRQGQGLLA